jgi:Family of unknown function (DUF6527)
VSFIYQAVERIPKQLDSGVLYYSEEFEVAALLCACGCGHRVMLLVPDSHQVSSKGGMAMVRPSISVCDAPCKSHYFITAGKVEWLPAFSDAMATAVMHRQIARHALRDSKQQSWSSRVRATIARAYNKLKSAFGI